MLQTNSTYTSDTIKGTDTQTLKRGRTDRFRSYSASLQATTKESENMY